MSILSLCKKCGRHHSPRNSCPNRVARILVVEDCASVLNVLVRTLEMAGHEVVSALDGREAVRKFQLQGPFDLLITDVTMPGTLQGEDVISELRRKQEGLPVVVVTGYSRGDNEPVSSVLESTVQLMKPVPMATLQSTVNRLLDRQSGCQSGTTR